MAIAVGVFLSLSANGCSGFRRQGEWESVADADTKYFRVLPGERPEPNWQPPGGWSQKDPITMRLGVPQFSCNVLFAYSRPAKRLNDRHESAQGVSRESTTFFVEISALARPSEHTQAFGIGSADLDFLDRTAGVTSIHPPPSDFGVAELYADGPSEILHCSSSRAKNRDLFPDIVGKPEGIVDPFVFQPTSSPSLLRCQFISTMFGVDWSMVESQNWTLVVSIVLLKATAESNSGRSSRSSLRWIRSLHAACPLGDIRKNISRWEGRLD